MPKCLNDETKYYKGNEPSPKGLGYCAGAEEVGEEMIGKDGNMWVIFETKTCKKWVKVDNEKNSKKKVIDFDNLEENYYINSYIPNVSKEEITNETGLEEKFGGDKPFFIEGETWPMINDKEPIKLICQFKDPRKKDNILIRIFSNIDENHADNYDDQIFKIFKIELNEENLKKQIFLDPPSFKKPYKCYEIEKWIISKELKSLPYIMNKFGYNKIPCKYHEKYYDSEYLPFFGIKVGGTPTYCQYNGNRNEPENFLQLTESKYLPYGWGDAGIAHLNEEGYLDWDCY
jgi:hypothetical protein